MKAVIVVDVEEYGDYYADVYRKDADDRFEGRFYLKPMPNKQATNLAIGIDLVDGFKDGWNYGWNACLEEIEK